MPELIMRIIGVVLLASCIAAMTPLFRNRLSILQRAILIGAATTSGGLGIVSLAVPTWISQPFFFTGLSIVLGLIFGNASWFNERMMVGKVLNYGRLAAEARERGDIVTAQRYQTLSDLATVSLGRHIKEVDDSSLIQY